MLVCCVFLLLNNNPKISQVSFGNHLFLNRGSKRGYLPDVVLLDCQMPGMHGFEVCSMLSTDFDLAAVGGMISVIASYVLY